MYMYNVISISAVETGVTMSISGGWKGMAIDLKIAISTTKIS